MHFAKPYFLSFLTITIALMSVQTLLADERGLTLQAAEQLALQQDPQLERFQSMASAMEEQSVANGQLPDPKLSVGLLNFPTDTFRRDQEPMTQIQLGVSQAIPRGDTREIMTKKALNRAQAFREKQGDQRRMVLKSVREAWLELNYWLQAEEIIEKNRSLFSQLVEVTQYQYGAGRRNQQDVIRAQLELSRLDDRLIEIRTQQDKARSELARWIGEQNANRPLEDHVIVRADLPSLQILQGNLKTHPLLLESMEMINERQQEVALAREAYKPAWMVGLNYGIRDGSNMDGSERPDFLSAMVTIDLPLFREKRQDRKLKASQHQLSAAKHGRDNRYLQLKKMLESEYAEWQRLGERDRYYDDVLLPQAKQNSEISLSAYQNDTADFTTLMRARITELDLALQAIRIRINQAKSFARLRYLAGEEV